MCVIHLEFLVCVLIGWLVVCLFVCLFFLLFCCWVLSCIVVLMGWFIFVDCLLACLFDWLIFLAHLLACLFVWLVDWLVHWVIDCLIDCSFVCLPVCDEKRSCEDSTIQCHWGRSCDWCIGTFPIHLATWHEGQSLSTLLCMFATLICKYILLWICWTGNFWCSTMDHREYCDAISTPRLHPFPKTYQSGGLTCFSWSKKVSTHWKSNGLLLCHWKVILGRRVWFLLEWSLFLGELLNFRGVV